MRKILALIVACVLLGVPAKASAVARPSYPQPTMVPHAPIAFSQGDDHSTKPPIGTASRTSPVPPQEANDSYFVADDDIFLDQYLFREDVPNGRLPFSIAIDRYYSPLITAASVDSNGFLLDSVRQDLINRKLLPEQATLTLQVFDVDQDGSPCAEVDHVYVNGKQVQAANGFGPARLTSGNDTWSTWTTSIPIGMIKFPTAPGSNNQRPEAVAQQIEIDINVLQCPRPNGEPGSAWATEVDWGSISIPSPIRPLLFAHGWTGDAATFSDLEVRANAAGIPTAGQAYLARGILPIDQTSPLLVEAIDAAVTRFGVDKVNIFAHSKGGLVARQALKSDAVAKQVDHLITFSTPHHGVDARQMDVAIWNNCTAKNFPNATDLQNCRTSGEAIKVDNLRTFNYTGCRQESTWWGLKKKWVDCQPVYVRQASVDYRSIVGGILDIGDKNATYPWKADAQPFPNTANVDKVFPLATHTTINTGEDSFRCGVGLVDPEIYKDCKPAVLARSAAEPDALIMPGDSDQVVAHQEVTLAAGQAITVAVPVDGGSLSVFSAFSSDPLALTLQRPDGTVITPDNASSQAGVTYVAEQTIPMGQGWTYQYQVANPSTGTWTITAQATSATELTILGTVATTTALSLRSSKDSYQPGENVQIEAVLSQNETIIPGATMTGQVESPDGILIPLAFNDSGIAGDSTAGDGVLTAQIVAPAANGNYAIEARAAGGALVRIQTGSFAIADLSAQIQSVVASQLQDTNANGLADALDLTVEVAVTRAGHFELAGTLVDGAGNQIVSTATSTRLDGGNPLDVGSQFLTLHFDGKTIRRHGVNGPYVLTNLVLYDQTGTSLVVDTATNLYTTASYQLGQFEREALLFVAGTEKLIDQNRNGLYDLLDISVQFDLISPGDYSWNGRLVDQKGNEIAWFVGSGFLDNNTPAHFVFDGARIGRGRYRGPYLLRDVSLYQTSAGTANGIFTRLYTTNISDYLAFEASRTVFVALVRR